MTETQTNNDNPTINEGRKARFREAYERVLPDMEALAEGDLVFMNLDIPSAVATTLGAWKEIAAFREQVKALHGFDVEQFDKLEAYALAAWHAHSVHLAASTPAVALPELGDKAAATREQLLLDATALAKRGFIDGSRLRELKGPIGYKNVAVDIGMLVTLLREKWSSIEGKTALSAAELDAAETLADDLISAVGHREQAPVIVADAADKRQRAFSLLVKTYDQARRAISYLRWNKSDIDAIAPSLYAGRQNTNHRKNEPGSSAAEPKTTSLSSDTLTAMAAAATAAAAPKPATTNAVPAGFPGSDPFGK